MKTPEPVRNHPRQTPLFAHQPRLVVNLLCLTALLGSLTTPLAQVYSFSTLAGLAGTAGANDGTGSDARFGWPQMVAVSSAGNVSTIYVADWNDSTIRKVTSEGTVTTLAGLAGYTGANDGIGSTARFYLPGGVAADDAGDVFVGDTYNHTIRKITSAGVVRTLAGSAGHTGSNDGRGSEARFYWPVGVAVDRAGDVFVADNGNHIIRKVTSAGVVTTLAGSAGQPGSADGIGSSARFHNPIGVAVNSTGDILVTDLGNHAIRKVTSAGVVTTVAASAILFPRSAGVAVDSADRLYVADADRNVICELMGAGRVRTLAGLSGNPGSADGTGSAARFRGPLGLGIDKAGIIYVADGDNYTIRKGVPAIDAGMRAYDGTAVVKLALETGAQPTSPIRISKGTVNYGIILVPADSPDASRFRIQTSSGVKAFRKLP
jgi:hypothetical protein